MAGKKIKVHNKDLQKADEIINLPQRMVGWVQARMQWLAGGALALVVMLVMVWAFTSHGQVKERRAQMQYAQVLDNLSQQGKSALQGQLWQTLIPELQAVSEQFRGTRTALSAQMDLAEAYFQIRQFEQALQLDLKSARELSGNATLQSFVRYRLAMTYQELNKPDEAIAQLESLLSSHLASLQRGIHWQLGQLYRQKQETAKAAEQYQKALEVEGVYPPGALLQDALAGLKLAEQAGSATSVPSVKP